MAIKAMAQVTDKVKGQTWLEVGKQGVEYGLLKWKDGGGNESKSVIGWKSTTAIWT